MFDRVSVSRMALIVAGVVGTFVLAAPPARAHCDTMDGPVVAAGNAALAKGDVTHAGESVEAGRKYVEAYVEFLHFTERLFEDAVSDAAKEVER